MKHKKLVTVILLVSVGFIAFFSTGSWAAEVAVRVHIPKISSVPTASEAGAILEGITGVLKVYTDHRTHTASILYDNAATSVKTIEAILKRANYPVRGRVTFLKLSAFET